MGVFLKVLLAIALFELCFLPFSVESLRGLACSPSQKRTTYKDEYETCNKCRCRENGHVVICQDTSCRRYDGKSAMNRWGLKNFKVVKKCSPGVVVFNECNTCSCGENMKPEGCTKENCNLFSIQNLRRIYPDYPLLKAD